LERAEEAEPMRSTSWTWGLSSLGIVAILSSACGEQSGAGRTTQEFTKEREALQARLAKTDDRKERKAKAAKAWAKKSGTAVKIDGGFAQLERDYSYDPTGKRDPFRNFKWERPDGLDLTDITTPLEEYDLGQLSVVAVVWKTGNARALVQDPAGDSYIIGEGARVGKNAGMVKLIRDGLVVVTEIYVDYMGQETSKDIEMRMRRNEGG
jgi:Tfp pilus assembly protein PilP